MNVFTSAISLINDIIWHDYALFVLLGVGILFTVWSGFGQYRALTHGVEVIRGKFDDRKDPGAINHFQALSTALSATVGLGNIAGVALAIALGGPGALFWMWIVGIVGMCLKMTEVTQSMLFRDTSDPKNPHGGPMWVCKRGFAQLSPRLAGFGIFFGGVFCVTLLVSTVTGGNMFQAWNVADVSFTNFGVPKWLTGSILMLAVGAVIVGGIKRIGDVAARIVPFMCLLYVIAGLFVIVIHIGDVPATFRLIFTEAFSPSEGVGAFIGGTAGYGFLIGMQRALFSSEAGQGSAPIAHSAAKTDEPVREGVVAGLEPFIDTLCVCTVTGLVILLSGVWQRDALLEYSTPPVISQSVSQPADAAAAGEVEWQIVPLRITRSEAGQAETLSNGTVVYLVLSAGMNSATGGDLHRVNGFLTGSDANGWTAAFDTFRVSAGVTPQLAVEGVFLELAGASLTAQAFDSVLPGLGFWVVPLTAWMFAFSTIISWSYYGEQGMVYLLGQRSVMPYRVVYCLLILLTVLLVQTQDDLSLYMNLGTGVMLWANIPIMLIFGPLAMRAYRDYMHRLTSGAMAPAHSAPKFREVMSGQDVD
jgi:alanine or glycine:cation symporter, AGCS family